MVQQTSTLPKYDSLEPYINVRPNPFHPRRVSFSDRRFYTIALLLETGRLYYADKWVMIDRPVLIFASPLTPYAWEATANDHGTGYHCLFNESFLLPQEKTDTLSESPLFNPGKDPLLFLSYEQMTGIRTLMQQMSQECASDYHQKFDILRSYLHLLVHQANKLQSSQSAIEAHPSAAQRIVELFLNILDSQFEHDLTRQPLQLTTAAQFASQLSVHVNHLNRVVKRVTGKTTTDLIASRLVQESIRLLGTTTLSISDIAFALGFEEPASFSKFVKKHTHQPPSAFRKPPG